MDRSILHNVQLTRRQLRCLAMYYYDGFPLEDIAGRLKISRQMAGRHVRAGRRRLRRAGYAIRPKARVRKETIHLYGPEQMARLDPAEVRGLW